MIMKQIMQKDKKSSINKVTKYTIKVEGENVSKDTTKYSDLYKWKLSVRKCDTS